VTFLVKEGENPKSSKVENAVIVMNTDQIPTISVGILRRMIGKSKTDAAIFKKVAA